MHTIEVTRLQCLLVGWAQDNLRELPWRTTRDPWAVLVSEIMLQQTQVSRVVERHGEFMTLFPDPSACAAAPVAHVIQLWDGLGFNRRAVNLWKAANVIRDDHGGRVPADLSALLALPGIGPYTARAILAFAFERDVGVVDTNVGRLLARWTNQRLTNRHAQDLADALVPRDTGWLWNQSLFDFANAQCLRRDPVCQECVLHPVCGWRGQGDDPAANSAGVSGGQSRFEGSRRQVRGRLVKALRAGPVQREQVNSFTTTNHPVETVRLIVDSLVAEGLAEWRGGELCLPERPHDDP